MAEQFPYPGPMPRLAWISLEVITVNKRYQRELKPKRVKFLAETFSWSLFEPVMLSDLGGGMFNVFDGQHRFEAAKLRPDITEIPALVVTLEGNRAEAGAFIGVNTGRAGVSTVERYWAGLEADDQGMLAVRDVLRAAGCEVAAKTGDAKPNLTNAVAAISRAIKIYLPVAVIKACTAIREAWPEENNVLKGVLIEALSRIFRENKDLNQERLVLVLKSLGSKKIASNAEEMRKIMGGSAGTNIVRAIAAAYNKNLHQKAQIAK